VRNRNGPDDACADGCNSDGDGYCDLDFFLPHDRLWFRGEAVTWWTKSAELPALATTSPVGTAQNQAGVLGQPGRAFCSGAAVSNRAPTRRPLHRGLRAISLPRGDMSNLLVSRQ